MIAVAFCNRSTTWAISAIRHSKAKRIQHMPRHREAKKSGCDDSKDHERDDLPHEPLLDTQQPWPPPKSTFREADVFSNHAATNSINLQASD
jgi:hypothetical protein